MILILHRAHPAPAGGSVLGLARGLASAGLPVSEEIVEHPATMRELRAAVAKHKPKAVILSSSFDDRAVCEAEPDRAFRENTEAAISLAAAALEFSAVPVLISTAEVYGQGTGPYSEADPPEPDSVYANSMLRAEQLLQRAQKRALILRVGAILADGLWADRARFSSPVESSESELISPISAHDLGLAIRALVDADTQGVIHVANSGGPPSKAAFDRKLAELIGADPNRIKLVGKRERRTGALFTDRLHKVIKLPAWEVAAEEALQAGPAPPAPAPIPDAPVLSSPPNVKGERVFAKTPAYEGRFTGLDAGARTPPRTASRIGVVLVTSGKALLELTVPGAEAADIVLKKGMSREIPVGGAYVVVAVEACELVELG